MHFDNYVAASILRWLARATSLLSAGVLFLFLFGENGSGPTPREMVGLFFFPFGVVVGLALAWWREAAGATVALSSVTAFYLIYGGLINGRVFGSPWFLVFASPAALFLAAWALQRGRRVASV